MAISRAQLLKELLPGLNALFGLEYKKYEQEHKMIFENDSSDRSFEEETKLSGFGAAPVKDEGSAIAYDNGQEAWTARYAHETIAMGFSLTEEAVEDNLYDSLSSRYTKALARAMAYTKQVSGGVNSNELATPADLSETSLEAAVIQIGAWTDERGLLIAARPKKLVIPSALQFIATRILETDLRVGTADNDTNALRTNGAIPEGYGINHYLTEPGAWFLTTDVPNALKHFTRTAMSTSMDGDFDTGNARYKARERYSFGVSDPLGIFGSAGA